MMNRKLYIVTMVLVTGCIAIKPSQRIEFQAPAAYPEGIAYDSAGQVYYVSSAKLGSVGKVTPSGEYSDVLEDSTNKSTYGLHLHPDGKRIFVCSGDANYSKYSTPDTKKKLTKLLVLDKSSGKKIKEVDLAGLVPGNHFPNDLAFDREGNVYVTDSYANAIYKVDANDQPSLFIKDDQFLTEGVGLNGIVVHPDGYLLVASSSKGCLFKINISDKKISRVKTGQFFMGADGLLLEDPEHLVMVVNGGNDKIYRLESRSQWDSASIAGTTLIADRFTYPSTATKANGDIWVMNARFSDLPDSNTVLSKNFAIQKAVFKPIPEKLRQ